ncbi:hypothetical protein QC761_0055900 [Podospora bellae-mahoneyi]|uniref:Uncharacterized protein n=1 Tax=Podospora bellae-mahoneyi TaxID=2093777 RepID=A0ABR0FLC4_9PEZI|nr:hypothetical protein QC761_0055900 [Podospora bellae-mahoneyi]
MARLELGNSVKARLIIALYHQQQSVPNQATCAPTHYSEFPGPSLVCFSARPSGKNPDNKNNSSLTNFTVCLLRSAIQQITQHPEP